MPSPIAHAAAGYVLYTISRVRRSSDSVKPRVHDVRLLLILVGLSLALDLDAAVGIAANDLGRYHNQGMGSPVGGAIVALVIASAIQLSSGRGFRKALRLSLLCFQTHVLMDLFTVGRGVKLLWPFSEERFSPAVPLFYGLRWSDGLVSQHHVWTVVTELVFVLIVVSATHVLVRYWTAKTMSGR